MHKKCARTKLTEFEEMYKIDSLEKTEKRQNGHINGIIDKRKKWSNCENLQKDNCKIA